REKTFECCMYVLKTLLFRTGFYFDKCIAEWISWLHREHLWNDFLAQRLKMIVFHYPDHLVFFIVVVPEINLLANWIFPTRFFYKAFVYQYRLHGIAREIL